MPITPFLNGEKFDAETTRARDGRRPGDGLRGSADRRLRGRRQAGYFQQVAKAGERNPDALCE
jgi:hypothetical protein